MIGLFGDLVVLKLPDICLTGKEKPRKKKHTQKTCPDRGSNPGPLHDRSGCYSLLHSSERNFYINCQSLMILILYILPVDSKQGAYKISIQLFY